MTRAIAKTLVAIGFAASFGESVAQNLYGDSGPPPLGWDICIDPDNTQPKSIPYIINTRANDLSRHTVGGFGTVTYGGQNSPCWADAHTYNINGRIGFAAGPQGSIQSNFDDDMQYTFGMPLSPAGPWSYANVVTSATANGATDATLLGASIGNFYAGESGRYIYAEQTANNVYIQVRTDAVGDGTRVAWTMTNLGDPQYLGLYYGAWTALLTNNFETSGYGDNNFIVFPGHKPIFVDGRYRRRDNPGIFPDFVQFVFSQENGYGLQVDLGPTQATSDDNGNNSDATSVDEIVIGSGSLVLGDLLGGNDVAPMPDFIFGDVGITNTGFIIKYEPTNGGLISTNAKRSIVTYFRDTWGNSRYSRPGVQPFTTVVDAPHILANDTGGTGSNGLTPNPFPIRVYIDNVGGYTNAYQTFRLSDVRVTLTLGNGLSIANGDPVTKTVTTVNPFELPLPYVEWQVQSDGIEVGDLSYSVKVQAGAPNVTVNHQGTIRVSATPRIKVEPGANLVSVPWIFGDSSYEAILGLNQPSDFTAYNWDPEQQSYVVATSAQRGIGSWIVMNPNTHGSEEVIDYLGASAPGDIRTGAPDIQLKAGWNLIGDPYQYAIPVAELVGVSEANSGQSYSFAQLVSQGIVSAYLAYYDPAVGNYRYVQGINAQLEPNKGYWIKVLTSQDLTINFPAVYDTFVPGGFSAAPDSWKQTPDNWRLQMQVRGSGNPDSENYLGVSTANGSAPKLRIFKPPFGPSQDIAGSFTGSVNGQTVQLAQLISDHIGQNEWQYVVQSRNAGQVTLSWPNLSTVPRNLTFKLIDTVTNQTIDMRAQGSYVFAAQANSTRTFKVQSYASAGGSVTITNLGASAGKISSNKPMTARFTLNMAATVKVRILDMRGREVATVRDGDSLDTGVNTAAWNLRDQNGRVVAPGRFQIEVTATVDGRSVQKTAPFFVNR